MTGCDAGSVRAVLRGKGTKRGTSTRSSNGVLELLWTDEIVIERVFHRSEKSEFFVCGRPCKEAEVRMACLSLGIDVSSPAVLLQQEKAAAVAMLSQTGRLSLLEDAIESHENRMAIAEESGRGHDAASERHANTQSAALQMEYRDDEPRGSATQTTDVECFSNGGTRTGELPRNAPVNELHRLASSKCKLIKEQNERIRAIERKNEEEKIKLKEIEEQLEVYKSKVRYCNISKLSFIRYYILFYLCFLFKFYLFIYFIFIILLINLLSFICFILFFIYHLLFILIVICD